MKLTPEQLAAIITKIFANLVAAGKDPASITTEEIIAELNAAIEAAEPPAEPPAAEPPAAEPPATEPEGDEPKGEPSAAGIVTPELIEQIIAALGGAKGAESPATEPKATEPPAAGKKAGGPGTGAGAAPAAEPQRKYVSLFLNTGAVRDGSPQNGFKSRIASMSDRERRKATLGAFGRAVKCIHFSHGDPEQAAHTAAHKFQDAEMAREFKALSATVPSEGGYLVPAVYADEIIELLYPATVIYDLGARRLGMDHGNLNLPKLKTGSRAMYTGEQRSIPKTAPKFGNLKLSAKKLTALIPMSNDLLRSTSFDNDVIVGQDVTKQMALGIDWGAIQGTGGEFQPLGILRNKGVLNIDATALGAEYASKEGVLTAMFPNFLVASVLKNNVFADGLGFAFNTSVEQFFKSLRDNVGGFIFAEEMTKNGTLVGYPYRATNLLETVGGKTSVIFGNWNDLVIGEQGALEIETSREGSWTDEAGNIVSAFENDQTLIRAINHVDTGLRHDESFAVATKVAVPV